MQISVYILWAQRIFCLCVLIVLLGIDLLPIWSSLSLFPTTLLVGLFYLFIIRPDILTVEVLVFLGLIQDGVYGYPLGLSILMNLLLYALLFTQRRFIEKQSFLLVWGLFGIFVVIAYVLHWGLLSYARHEILNFSPRLTGMALTIALFPWGAKFLSYGKKEIG